MDQKPGYKGTLSGLFQSRASGFFSLPDTGLHNCLQLLPHRVGPSSSILKTFLASGTESSVRATTVQSALQAAVAHDRSAGSFASHPQKFIPTSTPSTFPPSKTPFRFTLPWIMTEKRGKREEKKNACALRRFRGGKKKRKGRMPSSVACQKWRAPPLHFHVPKTDFPGVDSK